VKTCTGLCATALALAAARPAGADPAVGVTLSVDPCVAADAGGIERLFFLELGTTPARGRGARARADVAVGCAGDAIEVRVNDPLTGKMLSRRIDPGVAAGRERLIALAAVELLVASWIELSAADSTADDPALGRARADAERLVAGRLRPRPWTTTASVIAGAGADGLTQLGAGVRLDRDRPRWGWSAELSGWTGARQVPLGTIAASGLGGAADLHLGWRRGPLLVRAGAGGRIGVVALDGDPAPGSGASADHVTGASAGPFARAGAALRAATLELSLAAEAGVHLAGVRGLVDGMPGASLVGAWLTGWAGVGWWW
jgi:hypothetical protein